jgi:hypothetical protein
VSDASRTIVKFLNPEALKGLDIVPDPDAVNLQRLATGSTGSSTGFHSVSADSRT